MPDQPYRSYYVPGAAPARRAGASLIGWWCAAIFAGHIVSGLLTGGISALGNTLGSLIEALGMGGYQIVMAGVTGLAQGLAQWLVLRRFLPKFQIWIPAVCAANLAGAAVQIAGGSGVIGGVLAALISAAIQWLALRTRLRDAQWWIAGAGAASLVTSWLSGWLLITLYRDTAGGAFWPLWLGVTALSSCLYGLGTGLVLIRLLRRNAAEPGAAPVGGGGAMV